MQYLLFLTLLLVPTYENHFSLFGLPANPLMLWIIFLWLLFVAFLFLAKKTQNFIAFLKNINLKTAYGVALFFLSGIIAVFVAGVSIKTIGQFFVLFFQPLTVFVIFKYFISENSELKTNFTNLLYVLLGLFGIFAIVQYVTLFGLPPLYWGNSIEPKRATSFFHHPNFYALFSVPLLSFLLPDLFSKIKINVKHNLGWIVLWLTATAGAFLSLSRAGWLGLCLAIFIYVVLSEDRKIRTIATVAFVSLTLIVFSIPNLRFRVLLPFYKEKSAISRLSLWKTGAKAISQSPIFGLGLTGFSKSFSSLNTDPNLDSHNFPHNIFLNFWVETGIVGLISFTYICFIIIKNGLKNRTKLEFFGAALFVFSLLAQGLIDNPYFKNDLALTFWIIASFAL